MVKTEQTILNTAALEQIFKGIQERLHWPIIHELLSDLSAREKKLFCALHEENNAACRLQLHSLKSLAETFGLTALSCYLKEMENIQGRGLYTAIKKDAPYFARLVGQSREALLTYMSRHRPGSKRLKRA
tara:strand:+ start:7346 stop:7735 length:390 start_codon:yes stop_codon:yes gene_type:complete